MDTNTRLVLNEACRFLELLDVEDGAFEARAIQGMMAFNDVEVYETPAQRNAVEQAATTIALCYVACAIIRKHDTAQGLAVDLYAKLRARGASDELLQFMSVEFGTRGDMDMLALEEAALAARDRMVDLLDTPATRAWRRVNGILETARDDPEVIQNPEAAEFLERVLLLARAGQGNRTVLTVLRPLFEEASSANAKAARQLRTENGSALVEAEGMRLYDATKWNTIADAAKAIYPTLQAFANRLQPKQSLSQTRFQKTLGEWLKRREKSTANS